VRGDQAQLADLGLERVGALDRVHSLGDLDHLRHALAVLGGREVGPDPGQIEPLVPM
jgi:hypothetical protein